MISRYFCQNYGLKDASMDFNLRERKKEKVERINVTKGRLGHACGLVVNVLALYSDVPTSNPAEVSICAVNCMFENSDNKQNRG